MVTILRPMPDSSAKTQHVVPLLAATDPPPFSSFNWDGGAAMLFLCDHASNRVPGRLNGLGLDPADLRRHIGWDIGAAALTENLATRLDSPAILAGFSRLVIDNNRGPDDPTSVPEISDGVIVPGNRGLTEADRNVRSDAIFKPYHAMIDEKIGALLDAGPPPLVISIHSFTPIMRGEERPWHVTVLWKTDSRMPQALLRQLRAIPGVCAGDNVPYSAHDGYGYTVERHAEPRGLAHALLEVRQDLIDTATGVAKWGEMLAEALREINADSGMHEVRTP